MTFIKTMTIAALLVCSASQAETTLEVTLSGSFYATSSHTIGLSGEKSAFVYSVFGASNLVINDGQKVRVSTECLGFDEVGGSNGTQGVGRCVWLDESSDKLFVSLSTEGEKNKVNIIGGTGKWLDASGSLVTEFVYLPTSSDAFFLGTDDGAGTIVAPNYK